ncbi:hypothetical protein [Roseomonas sp. BN140053]
MLSRNTMSRRPSLSLPDPLALSAGVLPRLVLALALSGLLWGAVSWAMSA